MACLSACTPAYMARYGESFIVMVSMSAVHQCKSVGSGPGWGLKFQALFSTAFSEARHKGFLRYSFIS